MQTFNVSFDTWKTIYQNHSSSWVGYGNFDNFNSGELITGNTDFIFITKVIPSVYNDYSSSISSSIVSISHSSDAIALLVAGVSNIKSTTRDGDGNPIFALNKTQLERLSSSRAVLF